MVKLLFFRHFAKTESQDEYGVVKGEYRGNTSVRLKRLIGNFMSIAASLS